MPLIRLGNNVREFVTPNLDEATSIEEVRQIPTPVDKQTVILVASTNEAHLYKFDADSTAEDEGRDVLQPLDSDGPGRWLQAYFHDPSEAPDTASFLTVTDSQASLPNSQFLAGQGTGLVTFSDADDEVTTKTIGNADQNVPEVDGGLTTGQLLEATNDGITSVSASDGREALGLGNVATLNTGTGDGDVVLVESSDPNGLRAGEIVQVTSTGVRSKNDAETRDDLGLGSSATVDTGTDNGEIPVVTENGGNGLANGDILAATSTGLTSVPDDNLRDKVGYGRIAHATNVTLNTVGDTELGFEITNRFRLDRILVSNSSTNISNAVCRVYDAPEAGGNAITASQSLSYLDGGSAYQLLPIETTVEDPSNNRGHIQNNTAYYFRVTTNEGSGATANVDVFGYILPNQT